MICMFSVSFPADYKSMRNERIRCEEPRIYTAHGQLNLLFDCDSKVVYINRIKLNCLLQQDILIRLTTSLGNLLQCSVTLTVKEWFLMFRWNILCFSLWPLPLVLALSTIEKALAPSSLHSPFRYVSTLIEFSLSLTFSRLNSPSCPSLSWYVRCSSSLTILVALH